VVFGEGPALGQTYGEHYPSSGGESKGNTVGLRGILLTPASQSKSDWPTVVVSLPFSKKNPSQMRTQGESLGFAKKLGKQVRS